MDQFEKHIRKISEDLDQPSYGKEDLWGKIDARLSEEQHQEDLTSPKLRLKTWWLLPLLVLGLIGLYTLHELRSSPRGSYADYLSVQPEYSAQYMSLQTQINEHYGKLPSQITREDIQILREELSALDSIHDAVITDLLDERYDERLALIILAQQERKLDLLERIFILQQNPSHHDTQDDTYNF